MKKICMCFNCLATYREAIYTEIDNTYDCDWYIEENDSDIKQFSEDKLHNVKRLSRSKLGPFYWEHGLINLLWRKEYNIYFMYGGTGNVSLFIFCLLKSMFFPKKRVYFWTHGFYGKESKFELFIWKRPLFRMPDGLFTYGNYAKEIMINDGFDSNKIFPIHNSLDYDKQLSLRIQITPKPIYTDHFCNHNPVIVFIGRLTPVKRLDMIINAVAKLKEKGESYNIVFVGEGIVHDALEKLAKEKKIINQVWFYGACYDESKNAELIYNADLCVAPGNIGLTAIHSLMFGCPAISHNDFKWQMPEFEAIHPGKTGDFFTSGNVDSLSETIHNWFINHRKDREIVRQECFKEIDTNWNPNYQMNIIRKHLI